MTLVLFIWTLFFGVPDVGTGTAPGGIQLNGNTKKTGAPAWSSRPALRD